MKVKKVAVVLCMLLVAVLLVSCTYGSYVTKKSVKQFGSNSMYMRYESFSGQLYRKFKLNQGEKLPLFISTKTESGNLMIELIDEYDTVFVSYDTEYDQTKRTEFVAEEKGVYRLRIKGEHSGSFDITWQKE